MIADKNESLRSLAEKSNLYIGTCVSNQALDSDPEYAKHIAREFNLVTAENALKFNVLCPEKDYYNFEPADKLLAFAEKHGMQFRGHVLVWDQQLPGWLTAGNFSRTELINILTGHIDKVVSRYAGRIAVWDVVNEAIDQHGDFRKSFWYNGIGPDYVEIAFHAARAADPTAKLFYNDYGAEGSHDQEKGIYLLLKRLKERAVPVDGVGFQMHLSVESDAGGSVGSINTDRLTDLGLEFNITELDVKMNLEDSLRSTRRDIQSGIYSEVFSRYGNEKKCGTFILWGFTDKYSWIPFFYPGLGEATIMTKDYACKPAYFAIQEALKNILHSHSYSL